MRFAGPRDWRSRVQILADSVEGRKMPDPQPVRAAWGSKLGGSMRSLRPIWLLTGALVTLSTGWAANQPPDFPIRCHGTSGMATTSGKNLIVDFRAGDRPAGQ